MAQRGCVVCLRSHSQYEVKFKGSPKPFDSTFSIFPIRIYFPGRDGTCGV